MILKELIKKIWFKAPWIIIKRHKYITKINKHKLTNNSFSIFCSNCIGGIIYHNMNLQFQSPTINLWIKNKDFIKMMQNLEHYLESELVEVFDKTVKYPIGMIDDVLIHFNHYKSFNEANIKWNERKQRIDFENLYFMLSDEGLSYDDIVALENVRCKRLIIFTAKDYGLPYCFQLKKYQNKKHVGLYSVLDLNGLRPFEKEFNYILWLNGEDFYRYE
jgi:uncharacterized protein (DUF1919 family)